MDDKISICIVEDYMLARITFEKALKKYDDIEIKGSFESGEDCLEALEKERVQVVIMDIGLPYITGIEATKIIKDILTEEEFENAKGSTLNAFYTTPTIINNMYLGLLRLGFKGGNILEPSARNRKFYRKSTKRIS